jgi:hypothetical protein
MYRSKYTGLVSRAAAMYCSVSQVVTIIRCGIGKSSDASAAAGPARLVAVAAAAKDTKAMRRIAFHRDERAPD